MCHFCQAQTHHYRFHISYSHEHRSTIHPITHLPYPPAPRKTIVEQIYNRISHISLSMCSCCSIFRPSWTWKVEHKLQSPRRKHPFSKTGRPIGQCSEVRALYIIGFSAWVNTVRALLLLQHIFQCGCEQILFACEWFSFDVVVDASFCTCSQTCLFMNTEHQRDRSETDSNNKNKARYRAANIFNIICIIADGFFGRFN